MSRIVKHVHNRLSEEMEMREKHVHEKAMNYLHTKYPETEDCVFFTDYTGQTHDEVIQVWAVAEVADIEKKCSNCKGGECVMSGKVKGVTAAL